MGMEGTGRNLEPTLFKGSTKSDIPGFFRILPFSHTFFLGVHRYLLGLCTGKKVKKSG
jgi:hypothetical protein